MRLRRTYAACVQVFFFISLCLLFIQRIDARIVTPGPSPIGQISYNDLKRFSPTYLRTKSHFKEVSHNIQQYKNKLTHTCEYTAIAFSDSEGHETSISYNPSLQDYLRENPSRHSEFS